MTVPAPLPTATAPGSRAASLLGLFIAAAAFALYARGLNGPFLYDDTFTIIKNPAVRDLGWALRTFGSPTALAANDSIMAVYRPMLPLEFALIHAVFGLRPFGFHLVLALLHALNAWLLFSLLRRATSWRPAAWAAAWWAFHPAQVEAVQFASGLRDVSTATYLLLTALLLAQRRALPAALAFLLALLSKEISVMAAGAIFVGAGLAATGDWRQRGRQAAATAAPFLALAGLYVVLRASLMGVTQKHEYWGGSLGVTALTMAKVFLTYLRVTLLPICLRIQYYPTFEHGLSPPVVAGILALAGMIAAALSLVRRRPLTAFGIFAYFVFLLPVSNLLPTVQLMNERFFYLPLAGVAAVIADTAARLPARRARAAAGGVVLALLFVLTWARIGVWLDEEVFLKDIVGKEPRIPGYQRALGEIYRKQGRLADAEQVFARMRTRWPDSTEFAVTLAGVYASEGKFPEAERTLREILVRRRESVAAARALADFLFDRGRFAEAASIYEQLAAVLPQDAELQQRRLTARAAANAGAP